MRDEKCKINIGPLHSSGALIIRAGDVLLVSYSANSCNVNFVLIREVKNSAACKIHRGPTYF
jgi:hypothetical protein